MSSTSDLGIPVTLQNCFSPAVCPLYFWRTQKARGDRGQCLNMVLNNLTCDHTFFPFLRAGEREKTLPVRDIKE